MKGGSPGLRKLASAWYGVIPDSWEAEKFKHLATIRNGQVDPEDPRFRELPLFAPNHIESGTGRIRGVESADEQGAESGKYLVRQGEIVYSKIRPALRKAALAPCDGLCSADMYPVAPRRHVNARFLLYEMLSEGFSRYALLESDRVAMPKINREALGECPFVLPDLIQQVAIAAFLDRKTAAIDALIAKKERLIELLGLKRQALITQAVTRGLDPNVPMKGSGIEWLEEIPRHWTTRRGRFLFRELSLPPQVDEGVVTAFRDGEVTLRENRRSEGFMFAEKELGYQHVRRGDLVIHSMDAFAGAIGVSASDGKCTPEYVLLEPRHAHVSNGYYALLLRVMAKRNFIFVICPSVRERAPRFRYATFKDVLLPVPPLEEQRQIASAIEEAEKGIQKLMVVNHLFVERLREYRQALISAAVTGKIEIPAEEAA